jgi:hypothetical protein
MPLWYNPPFKDSKFASVACSDWESVNSRFDFEELVIKSNDDFYYLFGQVVAITDLKYVKGEKDWKFEPQLIQFKIARKDYEKYDYQEKKRVPTKQSIVERFYCKCIEDLNLADGRVYKGKIFVSSIPQIEMVVRDQLTPEMVAMTIKSMCDLLVVETSQFIKLEELRLPEKSAGGYGKTQSESERLNEQVSFIVSQCKLLVPELQINSIVDLYAFYNNEEHSLKIQEALHFIGKVLGYGG